jgi:predicted nucleic acid-binding protein
MSGVIVDTGPIVALLNSSDAHHAWTRDLLATIEPPLVTCEAVVSEACFLSAESVGVRTPCLS